MYFSRLFAQNILKTDRKFRVFLDVVLDIVVAVVLLMFLAFVLYEVIDFVNIYVIKKEDLYIPIEMYKEQIFKNPFGKDVLWITMMFISTLIPTLLHVFLALFSFFAFLVTKPHLHTLTDQLKSFYVTASPDQAYLEKEKGAKYLVRYRLTSKIRMYLFIVTVLVCVLAVVGLMLLYKGKLV